MVTPEKPMAPRRSSVAVKHDDDGGDDGFGAQRERAAFVDRREPARELAATGHREHGAGDARARG